MAINSSSIFIFIFTLPSFTSAFSSTSIEIDSYSISIGLNLFWLASIHSTHT